MLAWAAKRLFGTANERAIRKIRPRVSRINDLEPKYEALSDAELQAMTPKFKEQLDNGASLDDILNDAFAVCREASKRTLKMRHFDVQLVGGMVLHNGSIAEMKTGEGKTLVSTLPAYLNALSGKGVHIVTVNDYLAQRDSEWMGHIHRYLGLEVGVVVPQQGDDEKRRAYLADITYGQNNEFGFDYLRDNMKFSALEYQQRPLNYAIIDEVDSILIYEARTPLIISGPAEKSSEKYRTINEIIPKLQRDEHYNVDEKAFSVTLTDDGVDLMEKLIGIKNLYDPVNVQTLHIAYQLLRAHALYKRDQHYLVSPDGKVLIIDEFTGRVLSGRRWSDGLHQAVEAKENVRIQEESRTFATITFQNLFRIYDKLSGMTGTAETEAPEFHSTYKLDCSVVPTNKPMIRQDDEDVVYKTEREKFTAVIKDIIESHERGQPVLVGTTSVEKSSAIARILKKKKIPHHVLNAKHHENEAFVVAQAGSRGAITVSTNMAGRGTDIVLGGNPEMLAKLEFKENNRLPEAEPEEFEEVVERYRTTGDAEREDILELGGLRIIGTERHESRRIDNQLRGRAGRQGDPGASRFYLSLEDDLMRIFAGDRVKNLMDRMGMPDDEPIEHPWVTKSVENAQRKVEERNFDIRKNLLEYDDVMNSQRKTIYTLRQQLLEGRYKPEELDELGKATGETRSINIVEDIHEEAQKNVATLLGYFTDDPLQPTDDEGNPRPPTREEFEKVKELTELKALQTDVYQIWGVKLEIGERLKRTPVETYDELVDLVARGLSEQRERMLDLIDRVASAVIEESCPTNVPPEDWDWAGIHSAFKEHFKRDLDDEVDELGDIEQLARDIFARAEAIYDEKEKAIGVENLMRLFRHYYLEEIDRAWIDHLTNMEHLRDGIGLRGYGQRDPKNEYKKEGYNLFVNLMANVSSSVLERVFDTEIQARDEIAEMEAEAEARHQEELAMLAARHAGEQPAGPDDPDAESALEALRNATASVPAPQPQKRNQPKIGRNDECPCGSGKKFKQCHGAALLEEA